jgi:hypothetical protein
MLLISDRDLELMLLDRGVAVDHTTVFRWIQAYVAELEKRIRPHLRMQQLLVRRRDLREGQGSLDLVHRFHNSVRILGIPSVTAQRVGRLVSEWAGGHGSTSACDRACDRSRRAIPAGGNRAIAD